jgi:ATP-dependent helicase/nuclease subunit A
MTIHALCGSLLRRFPLEARVAPHFETIDDRSAVELMREAREAVLAQARNAATPLGRALELLAVTLAETSLVSALDEIMNERIRLLRARDAAGGQEALIAAVWGALGVEPGTTPRALIETACADGVFDAQGLSICAEALIEGSDTDGKRGRSIQEWLSLVASDRARLFETYSRCFLKADGNGLQRLATRQVKDLERITAILVREQARLVQLAEQLKAVQIAQRTEALLRVGLAVVDAYESHKEHEAALDYDDLIERTRALLHLDGKRDWVLYKLDARIEHILVDEAQDTSPAQWAIIEKLSEEFFAGQGAHDGRRTLFVVGDEKQSIYSFQGADLENFRRVRGRIRTRAEVATMAIAEELLDRSFRSVRSVLGVVDRVFALPEAKAGVVDLDIEVRHETQRQNDAGHVELWPLAPLIESADAQDPWPLPDVPRVTNEPERRIAGAIADTVRRWLDDGEILESVGRPITPGDVLVLVQRRGILQELLIRALKKRQVPVAGADRLALGGHIAVMDLVALGQAMLLPEDDLNLACLLKSPLVGLDEDDLFDLAWNRGNASLLERLRAAAETAPDRFG